MANWACEKGYEDTVRLLISGGADFNIPNTSHTTPAHAALQSYPAIVDMIIRSGNLSLETTYGHTKKTLAHRVAEMGLLDTMRFLLSKGANMNAKDNDNRTPVHYASEKGDIDMVTLILIDVELQNPKEVSSIVSASTKGGSTAAHYASRKGKVEIVYALVEHGASLMAQNKEGKTVIEVANSEEEKEKLVLVNERVKEARKKVTTSRHVTNVT